MHVDRLDLAALAVLLLLAFGAYLFLSNNAPKSFTSPYAGGPCAAANTTYENDVCFAQLALSAHNASICRTAIFPDACAGLYAYEKNDTTACDVWTDPQACRYFTQSARLIETNVTVQEGLTACRSFTNATWRYACLESHAQTLKNPAFCHEMEIDKYKYQCLQQVKGLQQVNESS